MARGLPERTFTGSDYHDRSIELARKSAAERAWPTGWSSRWPARTTFAGGPTTW